MTSDGDDREEKRGDYLALCDRFMPLDRDDAGAFHT